MILFHFKSFRKRKMCWRILGPDNLLSYDFISLILRDITDIELIPNQKFKFKMFYR